MSAMKWIFVSPQVSLLVFNFVAMLLLFISSFGTPFLNSVSVVRIETSTPASPFNGSYNLGVFGICADFDQVGRICSSQVVGYSLDALFNNQQFIGTYEKLALFSSSLLPSSFNLQSATRSLITHVIAFFFSLLTLILSVVGQIKQHALSSWSFTLILLLKLITLIAFAVDLALLTSLEKALGKNVKLVPGPSTYLTLTALISLFLGGLIFKLQTAKIKRQAKTLDDCEMSTLQAEAKWNSEPQHEDNDVESQENIRQLREILYNTLGPQGSTSSKRASFAASTFTSPQNDENHEEEGEEEPISNILTIPRSPRLDPPTLRGVLVNKERRGSPSLSSYAHMRSQSLPLQVVPLQVSPVYLPESPYSQRIIRDISMQGSPLFNPPSFRSAIPSSGIPSNVSSRRTSSLKSQNLQRNPSNSSSMNYRPRSQARKLPPPPRPTHTVYSSHGLRPITMASISSSTLDSLIPDFPPVPPLDPSYYPYSTFQVGERRKIDSPISSSSFGAKTGLSALPSSDGDGPLKLDDLDDFSTFNFHSSSRSTLSKPISLKIA